MKTTLVFSSLVALAWCAPTDHSLRDLPALRYEEVRDEYGQFAVRYITVEDTVVSERGRLIRGDNGALVMVIEGQYQFVGTDGKVYVTRYHAGPDGFHVDAEHLPQPVPVPVVVSE